MDRLVLPHNLEAEESVIGGVLFAGVRALSAVAEMLAPEDFYHPSLQAVYEAMLGLDYRSQPIDALSVAEAMRAAGTMGKLTAQGAEAYLADLSGRVATVENIAHHAGIVRDKAQRRRVVLAFSVLRDKALSEQEELPAALEQAERALTEVTRPSRRMDRRYLDEWCADEANALAQQRREGRHPGAGTGFWELDGLVIGWQPGELGIIAARPSMGKTAFVMSSAVRGALGGIPHLVVSAEMRGGSIAQRAISGDAEIPLQALRRRGVAPGEEAESLRAMLQRWRGQAGGVRLPVQVAACRSPRLAEVRREVRRWHREIGGGLAVVWLDYLQLVQAPLPGRKFRGEQNRERDVAEVSAGLKDLALELGISVNALSQLNRKLEERPDKRPQLGDLRESGAIEQDADLVLCLYRDEHYNPTKTKEPGVAEVIARKQRNGSLGTIKLRYAAPYVRFDDMAPQPLRVSEQQELI